MMIPAIAEIVLLLVVLYRDYQRRKYIEEFIDMMNQISKKHEELGAAVSEFRNGG